MRKKILQRGLMGIPVGITISYIISITISFIIGDGSFYPVSKGLLLSMRNELYAVLFQFLLSSLTGMSFAMASIVWELESWSLLKQSIVYFTISCAVLLPISYLAHWMPHSTTGILGYTALFICIFVTLWLVQYLKLKISINKINKDLKKKQCME